MTSFGVQTGRDGPVAVPLSNVAGYLLGVAVLAGSLTLLFLSMRAVMDVGGMCASGGPYVPRVECPDAVVAFMPLSIFSGLAGVGLMVWGGSAIPGPWASLALLAWPALFVSLGWNFLEYGFFPPEGADGWVWSWVFCGVLFMVMGLGPVIVAIGSAREALDDGGRAYVGGRVVVRPQPLPRTAGSAPSRSIADEDPPDEDEDGDVVDRLERLAALRRAGDITNEEYELAKDRLLRSRSADRARSGDGA